MAATVAERVRRHRERKRAIAAGASELELRLRDLAVSDPAGAVAEWSEAVLKVPPGHPRAGEPMRLPPYAVDWLREALAPGARESLLCMGRKNAKSACCAVLALACVCGPLWRQGFRGAVVSINVAKAAELVRQAQEIAMASGLQVATKPRDAGVFFRLRPHITIERAGATFEVLSADRTAGHASGFDLILMDETGLLHERDRPLLSGLRSSTSTRDGKLLHITIRGDSPHVTELIERRADPAVVVHLYEPPAGADACAPATWEYGNPGLAAGIKSRSYMADRARFVANVPGDLALFSAEDCNIPGSVHYETLVAVADWSKLETEAERDGPCVVGIDLGSTDSLSAAAVAWPHTGRLEVYAACAAVPEYTLVDRGRGDGVGARYKQLSDAGELWVYEGQRTTPVGLFISDLAGELAGAKVEAVGCDRFRKSELLDALSAAKLRWSVEWRGKGVVDGSADIRAFQRSVKQRWLRPCRGRLLLTNAISEAVLKRDPIGNATLHKVRFRGRIDAASATVIAASLAERIRNRPVQKYRSFVVGEPAA